MEQAYNGEMEAALAKAEVELSGTLKAAMTTVRNIKKAYAAAQTGNIRDFGKALDVSEQSATSLLTLVGDLRTGWKFDLENHMASGAYASELIEAAKGQGLDIFEMDGLLYCYPFLIRTLAGELAVQIDKGRERRIRPAVLARILKALQDKPVRFKPELFLESLLTAYSARGRRAGEPLALTEIYKLLTILPGMSRDYTLQEFARDIYLLDQSGITLTRDGKELRLAASTGTRGSRGTLRVITREGQERKYNTISFQ